MPMSVWRKFSHYPTLNYWSSSKAAKTNICVPHPVLFITPAPATPFLPLTIPGPFHRSPLGIWFDPDRMLIGLFGYWPSAWDAGQLWQAVPSCVKPGLSAKIWAAQRPLHNQRTLHGQLSTLTENRLHAGQYDQIDLFMISGGARPAPIPTPKSISEDDLKMKHLVVYYTSINGCWDVELQISINTV